MATTIANITDLDDIGFRHLKALANKLGNATDMEPVDAVKAVLSGRVSLEAHVNCYDHVSIFDLELGKYPQPNDFFADCLFLRQHDSSQTDVIGANLELPDHQLKAVRASYADLAYRKATHILMKRQPFTVVQLRWTLTALLHDWSDHRGPKLLSETYPNLFYFSGSRPHEIHALWLIKVDEGWSCYVERRATESKQVFTTGIRVFGLA